LTNTHALTERAVVGVLWTSLAVGMQAFLQLLALIVLARLLTPSQFGVFAAALTVIGLISILSEFGVAAALVQHPNLDQRHQRVGFTLSLLLSLPVIGLLWTAAPAIADFFHVAELAPVVQVASLACIFHGASLTAEGLAQRGLRFRWLAAIDAAAFGVGYTVVGTALAWHGAGVWALVGAHLSQHFVRMVCLLAGQPHPKRPLLERRAIGELLYFGGGFTLARIGNYFAGQGDKLVIGHWLGTQTLGLYVHAYQLMTMPAILFGQILDRVLFPTMALVQLEPSRLIRAYRSGVAVCALIIFPASLVLALVAPELVLVLLGPAWSGVVVPFQILALGMLFRTSYKLSDSVARATGAVYRRAWRQAIFALAIVLGALLGQNWGLGGAAVGVVAATALNFALMAQLSFRLVRMSVIEFGAAHLPALALGILVIAPTWALVTWLRDLQVSPLLLLLDVAIFAPVVGLLLCWCAPSLFVGPDARSLVRILLSVAPARLQRHLSA